MVENSGRFSHQEVGSNSGAVLSSREQSYVKQNNLSEIQFLLFLNGNDTAFPLPLVRVIRKLKDVCEALCSLPHIH